MNEDKNQGRLKEGAGKVLGDDQLEAEGKTQKNKGKAAEKIDEATDTVKGAAAAIKDKVTGDDRR